MAIEASFRLVEQQLLPDLLACLPAELVSKHIWCKLPFRDRRSVRRVCCALRDLARLLAETLSISSSGLSDTDATQLAAAVKLHPAVTSLCFDKFRQEDAVKVLSALQQTQGSSTRHAEVTRLFVDVFGDEGFSRASSEFSSLLPSVLPSLDEMLWVHIELTALDFESWSHLSKLRSLHVLHCNMGDGAAQALSKLTGLTTLRLDSDSMPSKDMAQAVAALTSLQHLEVHCKSGSYEEITRLSSLTSLTQLFWSVRDRFVIREPDLSIMAPANQALAKLSTLVKLQELRLPDLYLQAEGLRGLAALPQLPRTDCQCSWRQCSGVLCATYAGLHDLTSYSHNQRLRVAPMRRLLQGAPHLKLWCWAPLDVSCSSNRYPLTAEGVEQAAADLTAVLPRLPIILERVILYGSLQSASSGAYMGPVLGALAAAKSVCLRELHLYHMLLGRACLQQLAAACPQLTKLDMARSMLAAGAPLGLLPLINTVADGHRFELTVYSCKGELDEGGDGSTSLISDLAALCAQVQQGLVVQLGPEQGLVQQLRGLLEQQHISTCEVSWRGSHLYP